MENSIEEDITKINTYVELVLKKDYCNCNELNTILGKHCDGSKNVAYAMQHILSAYKRVLKENEILKEEKEQAWEEWNNLEQGSYETEQKLKQQTKELKKENEELKFEERRRIIGKYGDAEIHDVINKILSNDYIPVQKIKNIIDRINYDIEKTKEIISKNTNINASYRKNDYQIVRLRAMNTKSLDIKKRLQELLESEE